MSAASRCAVRGFTLLEVLVALVIVAFGMGAVLAALSGSAANVAALHDKTVAEWIALNRVADVRLNLQAPQTGTTEGDVKGFGNADWHWQQIVTAVQEIPGLMQVTVKVRRLPAGTLAGATPNSGGSSSSAKAPDWNVTMVGFRGDALAAASGEVPDWTGGALNPGTGSSSGGSSGGLIPNPGGLTGTNPQNAPGSITSPSVSAPGPTPPSYSSSGGP